MARRLDNTLLALRKNSRVLRHRRAFADCFGANPVASALGTPPGATPEGLCEHTMRVFLQAHKIGTFYFGRIRNFLLWADTLFMARDVSERTGDSLNFG
jgi:hypothetical protein